MAVRKAARRASVAAKVTPALSRWEDLRAEHGFRFEEMGGHRAACTRFADKHTHRRLALAAWSAAAPARLHLSTRGQVRQSELAVFAFRRTVQKQVENVVVAFTICLADHSGLLEQVRLHDSAHDLPRQIELQHEVFAIPR